MELPESVVYIDHYVFAMCISLTSVTINNAGSITMNVPFGNYATGYASEGSLWKTLKLNGTGRTLWDTVKSANNATVALTGINGEYVRTVSVNKPTVLSNLTYNGTEQEVTLVGVNEVVMDIDDDSELVGTDAGNYHVYISFIYSNYIWVEDGTNDMLDITWTINPKSLNSDGNIVLNQDNVDYDGNDHSPQ